MLLEQAVGFDSSRWAQDSRFHAPPSDRLHPMEWRYLSFDGDSRDGGEHGSQLSPCHRGVASSHPATTKPGQVGNAPRAWEYSVERIRRQFGSTPIGQQHKSVASSGAQPRVVPASGVAMAIAGLVVAKVNDSKVDPLVVHYGCPTESSLLALHSHQGIVPTQVTGCRVVKAKLPPPRILSGSVVVLGRLLHPPRRQGGCKSRPSTTTEPERIRGGGSFAFTTRHPVTCVGTIPWCEWSARRLDSVGQP